MNKMPADSFFDAMEMAPRDPILGITEAFNADQNPNKVNLGVGVYYDDNGKVPLLECVRQAEARWRKKQRHAPTCQLMVLPFMTSRTGTGIRC